MNFGAVKTELALQLQAGGIATHQLDARVLLAAAAGLSPEDLLRHDQSPIPSDALRTLNAWRVLRLAGMPVARIIGRREFYGYEMRVSPAVLDPRPETELLIDLARTLISTGRVLDLGTGSGCLLIALAHFLPAITALGVDISPAALRVARLNRGRYGLEARVALRQSHWLSRVTKADGLFDLVLANPPYIATPALDSLAPEVRLFDPHIALDGGADGLSAYRQILHGLSRVMRRGGYAAFEVGHTQARSVAAMMRAAGFTDIETRQDLAGHDRLIFARYK